LCDRSPIKKQVNDMPKTYQFRFPTIATAILLFAVFAPAALGAPAAGGTYCRFDYWLVSARHCPNHGRSCRPGCEFEYFHSSPENCLHRSDERSFLSTLQPGVPVCIMVHGSFVDWPHIQHESHQTYCWLRAAAPHRPLHVVFYTWPSEGCITMLPHADVAILGRRAEHHGLHLARLISRLPAGHPVCLLGHSHGARLAAAALHLLGGGPVQGYRLAWQPNPGRRIRAVFAAAALDHHWLNPGERYGRALCQVEWLLNLRNRRDLPLAAYPLRKPFSHRALARAGFTRRDVARLGWQRAKIAQIDVTPLIGTGHMWPNYYRRPEIAAAIVPFVYFTGDN
jgi:hypothetical protein